MSKRIDLNGKLHKLFDRKRWEVTDTEYNLLRPSMHLASNLLDVGMPYITNFLPSEKLYSEQSNGSGSNEFDAVECPQVIPFNETSSEKQISETRRELEDVSNYVRWQVNYEMYRDLSPDVNGNPLEWIGITRLVDTERPWEPTSYEDILDADDESRSRGLRRRPLVIGIMGEYVTALKNFKEGSEAHLRATFMAAITITHEVGHAIFHQDFRALNPPFLQEPWVGAECSAELGFSFISWIFNGHHPQARGEESVDFSLSLYWDPRYTIRDNPRPLYKVHYSIRLEYIENILTQDFWGQWAGLRSSSNLAYLSNVRDMLKPVTSLLSSATATVPNWSYSHAFGEPQWNDSTYKLKGFRKGEKVKGLTREEIDYVKARTKNDGHTQFEGLTKQQIDFRRKTMASVRFAEDAEDEDEEDFSHARLPPSSELHHALQHDIDDGLLETDLDASLESDATTHTRIVVTYLFGIRDLAETTSNFKRTRNSEGNTVRNNKKARMGEEKVEIESRKPSTSLKTGRRQARPREPDHLSYNELVELCRSYELPEWGTWRMLVTRVGRFQSEKLRIAQGEPFNYVETRPGQPHRTDGNGQETYVFKAILNQSSVTALKSALFIAGNFRPDAELKLFFNSRQTDWLRDGRALSSYKQKDWTSLRLKVSTKWRFGPGSLQDHPIDLTGPKKTTIEWAEKGLKSKSPPAHARLAPARTVAMHGSVAVTVGDMADRIAARIPALERIVKRNTGAGPQKRTSAVDIMDEVQDLEEDEERRDEEREEILAGGNKTAVPQAGGKQHPHMVDIYEHIDHPSKFKHGRPEL